MGIFWIILTIFYFNGIYLNLNQFSGGNKKMVDVVYPPFQSVDKTTLVDETEGRFFVFMDNFE